jgi:hypothetical protein
MTVISSWPAFLDDYEAKLSSTEAALDEGVALDPSVLVPFEAPRNLGTIPDHLIDRAVETIRRSAELGQRLDTALTVIQRDLGNAVRASGGPQSPFAQTSVPKYFNSAI